MALFFANSNEVKVKSLVSPIPGRAIAPSPAAPHLRRVRRATAMAGVVAAGVSTRHAGAARSQLFDLELDRTIADLRHRIGTERAKQHAHDLANAFAAVEGAATTLTRPTLTPADRSQVADLLSLGFHELRALLFASPDDVPTSADLAAALTAQSGLDGRVRLEVAGELVVAGPQEEITETTRLLIANGRRRCPSGPLTARAWRRGDWIELRVDDGGPRLSARQRRAITEPARRRRFGPISVTELDVAARLASEHGGRLIAEDGPGGQQSFGISWAVPVG
jgi:signal transduction histidine kinase